MNKKIIFTVILLILLSLPSCQSDENNVDANILNKYITENYTDEMGYIDVSELYYEKYFSNCNGIKNKRIIVSSESTNFDELGFFEFIDTEHAKSSKSYIEDYIDKSKNNFSNGIIYDVNEYPKFENSKVIQRNNVLIYSILDTDKTKDLSEKLK